MINFHVFLVINLVCLFATVRGEVSTATADLEELVDTEEVLIGLMKEYIKTEEKKIVILKKYVDIYQEEHNKAIEDEELYLSNPFNAYSLIKRLTTNWSQVERLLASDTTKLVMESLYFLKRYVNMKFPTEEDLTGAVTELVRLQRLYNLETSSLARGKVNGVKYSSELSAADCFKIGRICYDLGDTTLTKLWLKEADARLKMEANKTVKYSDILEYLAYSTYKEGNISIALDLINKLIKIDPANARALKKALYYQDQLKTFGENVSRNSNATFEEATKNEEFPDDNDHFGNYGYLCRGELAQSEEYRAKLKCKYLSRNDPFLKIAPFKVEEAHLDPELYIFHDVISDLEIETIKMLALPRFQRANVQDTRPEIMSNDTISKVAWLKNELHPHIADIYQRVADMTGLTVKTSEDMQVLNYGVGGSYEPNWSEKSDYIHNGDGNRLGTVLFYLNDVAQGGATVFPEMKAAVWPKKGTAAFWYNLHASGYQDIRTTHVACPVLAGSKWVSTKWLHERHQEFLRLCSKNPSSNHTLYE